MARRVVALLACVATFGACGGRTRLGMASRNDGGTDAGATDARPDGAGPACTWSAAGAAVRVSGDPDVPGDVGLMDAVPTVGGALIAWVTAGSLSKPQTAMARMMKFDMQNDASEHVVLVAPGVAMPLGQVFLGNGFGHVAIIGWKGRACVLRPITVDGASNGGERQADARLCAGIAPRAGGFDLMLHDPYQALIHLPVDPDGVASGPPKLIYMAAPNEVIGVVSRATLLDGTFLVATLRGGMVGHVVVRHFDATGAPLALEQALDADPDGSATSVALAATANGAIVAWTVFGNASRIFAAPVDTDGRPTRTPQATKVVEATPITKIDLAPEINGGALLAWVVYTDSRSSATVLALSPDAEPMGEPMPIVAPETGSSYAPAIRIVATDRRALVTFGARSTSTPHRVYTAPFVCAP